jgi:predicted transcriptional regulator
MFSDKFESDFFYRFFVFGEKVPGAAPIIEATYQKALEDVAEESEKVKAFAKLTKSPQKLAAYLKNISAKQLKALMKTSEKIQKIMEKLEKNALAKFIDFFQKALEASTRTVHVLRNLTFPKFHAKLKALRDLSLQTKKELAKMQSGSIKEIQDAVNAKLEEKRSGLLALYDEHFSSMICTVFRLKGAKRKEAKDYKMIVQNNDKGYFAMVAKLRGMYYSDLAKMITATLRKCSFKQRADLSRNKLKFQKLYAKEKKKEAQKVMVAER